MSKQNNGWISVDERLPNKGEEVLICIVNFFELPTIDIAYLDTEVNGTIYFEGTKYIFDKEYITHWQELPQPPETE